MGNNVAKTAGKICSSDNHQGEGRSQGCDEGTPGGQKRGQFYPRKKPATLVFQNSNPLKKLFENLTIYFFKVGFLDIIELKVYPSSTSFILTTVLKNFYVDLQLEVQVLYP